MTALIDSILSGNLRCARKALADGADANAGDSCGNLPLHIALHRHRTLPWIRLLLPRTENPNEPDHTCMTALMLAAVEGRLPLVRLLLADPRVEVDAVAPDGLTALLHASWAGNLRALQILLEHGADLHARGLDGETAMTLAGESSSLPLLKWLVFTSRMDVNQQDDEGWNALLASACNPSPTPVRWLVEQAGADIQAKTSEGLTPLHCAAQENRLKTVRYLVETCHAKVDDITFVDGYAPLHLAAANNCLETVRFLLSRNHADPNVQDALGNTPLMHAILGNAPETFSCLLNGPQTLPEKKNLAGQTALELAMEQGRPDFAERLRGHRH